MVCFCCRCFLPLFLCNWAITLSPPTSLPQQFFFKFMLHRLKALAPCFWKSTAHVICLDLVLSKEVCLYGDADWLRSPVGQWWEVSCATSLFTDRFPSVPYLYWPFSAGQVCLTTYLFLPSPCLITINSAYRHQQFFCGHHRLCLLTINSVYRHQLFFHHLSCCLCLLTLNSVYRHQLFCFW